MARENRSEYWDLMASVIEQAPEGEWTLCRVDQPDRKGGRTDIVRRRLEHRGLDVEVRSQRWDDCTWRVYARRRQ